jgi:hypothetical protein
MTRGPDVPDSLGRVHETEVEFEIRLVADASVELFSDRVPSSSIPLNRMSPAKPLGSCLRETTNSRVGSKINCKTAVIRKTQKAQAVGIKEVEEGIWLVSFMEYDLGYIDLEEKTLQPLENPFGPKV